MNRISAAIENTEKTIQKRIADGIVTVERVEEVRKSLDMDLLEYVKFQELKSLAVANQTLSLEEGMTIYSYLGESVETFNNQPVAVKSLLTTLFAEMLQASMQKRKRA